VTKSALILACSFAFFGSALAFGPDSASANVLILSSDAKAHAVGAELEDGDFLKIPEGESVRLLLPSGTTIVIPGPVNRPVKELTQDQVPLKELWTRVKGYLAGRNSSGIAGSRTSTGYSIQDARAALLSFSTIPVPSEISEGAICVLKDAPLSFARLGATPRSAEESFAAMKMSAGESLAKTFVVVKWEEQSETVSWPNSVSVVDGGWYFALSNFALPSSFQLKTVSRLSIDSADVLIVLEENSCYGQIEAWVLRASGAG
jgi:hypothetical protein